jgi:cytochrome c biogenesis protein CcmG/thiol:disulfide interchange protein DsbE
LAFDWDVESDGAPPAATARPRRVAPFIALAVALVLAGLFVVLASSSTDDDNQVQSFLLGRPAPRVVSTTLDDQPFDLSRRKGSWVVLNFFDPTCVPCVDEHPELIVFDEQQSALADGAELYTIINRGSDESVQAFFDANGGEWPVVRDPDGGVSVDFGVAQVPETWIIDPNGVVRRRFAGPVTAEGVAQELQSLREGRA